MVEDCNNFLRLIDKLKPYTVEFEEDGIMKSIKYLSDFVLGGEERRPIIVITHDEFTFSANDIIRRVWTKIGDPFLQPERQSKGNMTLELLFLFLFGRLNLDSLSSEKKVDVIKKTG